MVRFISRLSFVGVEHAENESEKQQIIGTNYLSMIIGSLSFIGMTVSCFDEYKTAFWGYFFLVMAQVLLLYLQKKGFHLAARILLTTLPQLLLILPPYFTHHNQPNFEHFYFLLAAGLIPALLFANKKETFWLALGIAYGLFFIMCYDTVLGIKSAPYLEFKSLDGVFLRFKVRQLMLYTLIISGYLAKIKLSQYFEIKLQDANLELVNKNKKIYDSVGEIQLQNEELQAQQEEMKSQNEELHLKQQEITDINLRIEIQIQVLIELTKSKNLKKGDLQNSIMEICKNSAKALEIQRVSIWEYDWKRNSIICQSLFETTSGSSTSGYEFMASEYQPYFDAIRTENLIVANNAWEHPSTECFAKNYLKINQIYSMLDAPYFINGEFGGVICCETVGNYKIWTKDEIAFLKSIADLTSLCYESAERKKAEDRIRVQKEVILNKNEELLLQQEKIQLINENLERKVSERTNLLEQKNFQLQEYTYVNSHLLRGPLCRILGIIYLLENNLISSSEGVDFLQHLKESASELDEMVKKITKNLEGEHPESSESLLLSKNIELN